MATRIVFAGGQETAVSESQDDVVSAVRRDHPNPVKLEGVDGLVLYVNWARAARSPYAGGRLSLRFAARSLVVAGRHRIT
ncbi:MAG: hypothetical protein QOD73_1187 [Solirubrobacteraceae bacterium]|nr:hypothetical protein [Solirubrobacteraceae bacterium]